MTMGSRRGLSLTNDELVLLWQTMCRLHLDDDHDSHRYWRIAEKAREEVLRRDPMGDGLAKSLARPVSELRASTS